MTRNENYRSGPVRRGKSDNNPKLQSSDMSGRKRVQSSFARRMTREKRWKAEVPEPKEENSSTLHFCSLCLQELRGTGDFTECIECSRPAHLECLTAFDQWKVLTSFSKLRKYICPSCYNDGQGENDVDICQNRTFSGLEHLLIALFLSSEDLIAGTRNIRENLNVLCELFVKLIPNNPYSRRKPELRNEVRVLQLQTAFTRYRRTIMEHIQSSLCFKRLLAALRDNPRRNAITYDMLDQYVSDLVINSFHGELARGAFSYRWLSVKKTCQTDSVRVRHVSEQIELVIAVIHDWNIHMLNNAELKGLEKLELDLAVTDLRNRGVVDLCENGILIGSNRVSFSPEFVSSCNIPSKTAVAQFGEWFRALTENSTEFGDVAESEIPVLPHVFQEVLQISSNSQLRIVFPTGNAASNFKMYKMPSYHLTDVVVEPLISEIKSKTISKLECLLSRLRKLPDDGSDVLHNGFESMWQELCGPYPYRAMKIQAERIFYLHREIYGFLSQAGEAGLSKWEIWNSVAGENDLTEDDLVDLQTALDEILKRFLVIKAGTSSISYVAYHVRQTVFVPYPWSPAPGIILNEVLLNYLRFVLHFIWEKGVVALEDIVSEFASLISGRSIIEITSMLHELELVTKYRLTETCSGVKRIDIDDCKKWMDDDNLKETFFECGCMWRSLASFEALKDALSDQQNAVPFVVEPGTRLRDAVQ